MCFDTLSSFPLCFILLQELHTIELLDLRVALVILKPSYKVQIKRNELISELCVTGWGVCSECVMTTRL